MADKGSRRMKRFLLILKLFVYLIVAICDVPRLFAATYYIAPDGLKTNDGSRGKPLPLNAALAMGGGHSFIFMPGFYSGPIEINRKNAGSLEEPTVLKSEIKWGAKIIGSPCVVVNVGKDTPHVLIDGFEIWGGGCGGVDSSSDYTTIRNCWIHNNSTMGISVHGARYAVIENNLIEFNGMHPQFHHGIYMDGSNQVIRGNIIRYNAGYGIHLYPDIRDTAIMNNVIYGHQSHAGAILVSSAGGLSFVNNTVANNAIGVELWGSEGTIIQNNIFFGNRQVFSFLNAKKKQVDYNLYDKINEIIGKHDIEGNPGFVNSNRGLFLLKEKSPAIRSGNSEVAPRIDFFGHQRGKVASPDLGAYMYYPLQAPDFIESRWQFRSRWELQNEIPDLWRLPTK